MGRRTVKLMLMTIVMIADVSSVDGRTWRITPDGTGDAPYLDAAMDSAVVGDTILVAAGEYQVAHLAMANGVVILSESGPMATRFVPFPDAFPPSAIACSGLASVTQITGIWFDGFRFGGGTQTGAIAVHSCSYLTVSNNVFTNNSFAGITIDGDYVRVINNTFVNNNIAIVRFSGGAVFFHNIIWGEARGLDPNPVACNDVLRIEDVPIWERSANFSADPMFCGPNNYRIQSASPCAPGNSPLGSTCDLIGALPAGCNVPVEAHTWGSIKSRFQKH